MLYRTVGLYLTLGSFFLCAVSQAQSIAPQHPIWLMLQQKDAQVFAVDMIWKIVEERFPSPIRDPEIAHERVAAWAKNKHLDAEIAHEALRENDTVQNQRTKQMIYWKKARLVSDRHLVSCDVLYRAPRAYKERDKTDIFARTIDVYDGQNNIYLSGMGTSVPVVGFLNRKPQEKLKFVISNPIRSIFLMQAPISSVFLPKNTQITENATEVTLQYTLGERNVPLLARITLSKPDCQVKWIELRNSVNNKLMRSFEIKEYRKLENGIEAPSKVEERFADEAGHTISITHYTLLSSALNSKADLKMLHPLVPDGSDISDIRFVDATAIRYTVKGGIPSDSKVIALLEEMQAAKRRQMFGTTFKVLLVLSGILGIGVYVMRRKLK